MKRSIMAVMLVLLGALDASAHAFLDHADPRVGSHVTTPPVVIKIWFTEPLEAAFSRIQVFDASGKQVDGQDSKLDATNGAIMTVSVPHLAPGTYKVAWSAVSVDTHHTTGTYSFTLAGP